MDTISLTRKTMTQRNIFRPHFWLYPSGCADGQVPSPFQGHLNWKMRGPHIAVTTGILYGGSTKEKNAQYYMGGAVKK